MRLRRDRSKGWLIQASFEEKDAVKALGARWLPDLKSWRLGASTFDVLSRLLAGELEVDYDQETLRLVKAFLAVSYDDVPLTTEFKIPPFRHQVPALKFLILKESGALFMDMGTGKTYVAIMYMFHRFLEGKIKRALIVCPLSLFDHWRSQIRTYAPTGDYEVTVIEGTKDEKLTLLSPDSADPEKLWIVIANFEAIWGRAKKPKPSKNGDETEKDGEVEAEEETPSDPLLDAYRACGFDLIVADEAHKIKNAESKQSRALRAIAERSSYRVIMTGTPVTNKITDLFGEYLFMDPVWFGDNFWAFQNTYCLFQEKEQKSTGRKFKILVGQKNEARLEKILSASSFRVKKSDCMDLPPQLYQLRTVEMTPEQQEAHQSMRDLLIKIVDKAGSPVDVQNNLTKTIRQRQITSGFLPLEGGGVRYFDPNPKLGELLQVAEQLVGVKPFLVWTAFLEDVHMIHQSLTDAFGLRVGRIYGDVPREERTRQIQMLKDGKLDCLDIQIQTAALGLDLSFVDTSMYYSNTYNWSDRDQSESRTHRRGAEKHESVLYIDFACKNSVDRLVLSAFRRKKSLAEYLYENRQRIIDGSFSEDDQA